MTEMREFFAGGTYFECPRWHDGRWWASDFYRYGVFSYDAGGREEQVVEVEGQPSGLGWLPGGDLLVVSMKDQRLLRVSDGDVSTHADLSDVCGGYLNDMVVDASGRAYVGDFGFDLMGGGAPASASVKRVDPDGSVVAAGGRAMKTRSWPGTSSGWRWRTASRTRRFTRLRTTAFPTRLPTEMPSLVA